MLDIHKELIERFSIELKEEFDRCYQDESPGLGNILYHISNYALLTILKTDALYHNLEHTMQVTLVGMDILKGKRVVDGAIKPKEWFNFITALLYHDIGYVKGICYNDKGEYFSTGINGHVVHLSVDGTDAGLSPYHVDRSKIFVESFFQKSSCVDAQKISEYIEMTRYPVPEGNQHADTVGFGGLVRASDIIGQLGDPGYMKKLPALFYEFEETGMNLVTGYKSLRNMRDNVINYFWRDTEKYVAHALKYLNITLDGQRWVENLQKHVAVVN